MTTADEAARRIRDGLYEQDAEMLRSFAGEPVAHHPDRMVALVRRKDLIALLRDFAADDEIVDASRCGARSELWGLTVRCHQAVGHEDLHRNRQGLEWTA